MIIVDAKLKERHKNNDPIKVGFIGAGVMAKAALNLITNYIKGVKVVAVSNRTIEKARDIFQYAGMKEIREAGSPSKLDEIISSGGFAITDDYKNVCQSNSVDIILEITGTIEFGAGVMLEAFRNKKHVLSFNAELDSTLGPILSVYADKAGVMYSGSDGDQPGVTMNLYRYVKSIGLTPLLCGNVKGLHDPYRTPATQEAFAKSWNIGPEKATAFADGTKLCMEQTCVANATGMTVAKRGMLGYEHKGHIDEMVTMYDIEMLKSKGGIIDYAVGPKPGPGVFVFATSDDPINKHQLKYLKMGDGPLYSFYTPYHLCMFDIPNSICRVVDFKDYVLRPLGAPIVETIAIAKKDLTADTMLDGQGFFTVYGICESSDIVKAEKLLPVGLADKIKLKNNVAKDSPITFDDVLYNENDLVFKLYREQLAI